MLPDNQLRQDLRKAIDDYLPSGESLYAATEVVDTSTYGAGFPIRRIMAITDNAIYQFEFEKTKTLSDQQMERLRQLVSKGIPEEKAWRKIAGRRDQYLISKDVPKIRYSKRFKISDISNVGFTVTKADLNIKLIFDGQNIEEVGSLWFVCGNEKHNVISIYQGIAEISKILNSSNS
jgi:hypothetical protein